MTHALMESRHGLIIIDLETTQATGRAECEAPLNMAHRQCLRRRPTLSTGKVYDRTNFVRAPRGFCIRPRIATKRQHSAVVGHTSRRATRAVSLQCRKRIEEGLGWAKTAGGPRKTRLIGRPKVSVKSLMTFAARNPTRPATICGLREPVRTV